MQPIWNLVLKDDDANLYSCKLYVKGNQVCQTPFWNGNLNAGRQVPLSPIAHSPDLPYGCFVMSQPWWEKILSHRWSALCRYCHFCSSLLSHCSWKERAPFRRVMSEEGCGIPLPGDIQKSSEHVWAPACIWTCISGTRQPPGVISLTPQPLSDSVMCNFLSGTCRGICSPELQKNRPESPSEQTSEHLCVTYKLNSKETLSSGPVFLWLKYLYQFGYSLDQVL